MKKNSLFVALLLMFSIIGQIRFLDDYLNRGSEMEMHINTVNKVDKNLNDVRIQIMIPDLDDERIVSNTFDVEKKEKDGKFVFWDVPEDTKKGEYLMRIVVSNDEHKSVKYRYVRVV